MLTTKAASLLIAVAVAAGGSAYFTVENVNQTNPAGMYIATVHLQSKTPFESIGSAPFEGPTRIQAS